MEVSSSRRKFITECLQAGTLLFGVGLATEACSKKESVQEDKIAIDSCDDFSGVSETELEKRKKFAYVKHAPDELKQCNSCKLYLPPKPGEKCGGCLLFKGPVDAVGSCTYWAPID
jgi:hypothetical protein